MMRVACDIVELAALKDNLQIIFEPTPMGWNAYEKFGDTLPEASLKRAVEIGTIFFGGVGDFENDVTIGREHPEMKPEARCLLALRKKMGLMLNYRPVTFFPELKHLSRFRPEFIPDWVVNQNFVRFLLEDSYFGTADLIENFDENFCKRIGLKLKKDVTGYEEMVSEIAYYRKASLEKYFRAIFTQARAQKMPVMSLDKANVMARYQFWRIIINRIAKEEFPDVEFINQFIYIHNLGSL